MDVDGQFGRLPGLREASERSERLLQVGNGVAGGGSRRGPEPSPAQIRDRLRPHLAPEGMVGEPLDVLTEPICVEPLDRTDELRVKASGGAPAADCRR